MGAGQLVKAESYRCPDLLWIQSGFASVLRIAYCSDNILRLSEKTGWFARKPQSAPGLFPSDWLGLLIRQWIWMVVKSCHTGGLRRRKAPLKLRTIQQKTSNEPGP